MKSDEGHADWIRSLVDPRRGRKAPAELLDRHLAVVKLRQDERELNAQLVNVLNRLQQLNELSRAAILSDRPDKLATLGQQIVDQGVTLVTLVQP